MGFTTNNEWKFLPTDTLSAPINELTIGRTLSAIKYV